MIVCICNATLSICHILLFPCCVHKSLFYNCASISALQICSSLPFFYIPCMVYMVIYGCMLATQLCLTLPPRGLYPARLLCPWDSPGKDTGVGCHILLQGIFLIYLSIWAICFCLFDLTSFCTIDFGSNENNGVSKAETWWRDQG